MLDIHDGACEPDIVMKKFIDFIKNKDPTRSSDFVLTISYYHHHCHGMIIVIKMAIMPWSLPHSIRSGSDQPLESLVLHALTQWNQSLEFRNTSRLLSLATGLRSIEVSIIQSFPDHDNLNLVLLIIMTTSAEGSISNSKSQADFPYFFRTIAENKQYK